MGKRTINDSGTELTRDNAPLFKYKNRENLQETFSSCTSLSTSLIAGSKYM